jgi:hypothetical protein
VGSRFAFDRVLTPCQCTSESAAKFTHDANPICDHRESDKDAVLRDLRVSIDVQPSEVGAGQSTGVIVRYTNTGTEPLHVLLDRTHFDRTEPLFPKLVDANGKDVPQVVDRSCREIAMLSMAELSLVVLEPGGVLERVHVVHGSRERRVGDGQLGCKSTKGPPLAKGAYTMKWSTYDVWDLQDRKLEATLTVK